MKQMKRKFSRYLTFKRDNNELLLFILRQLTQETAVYMRNRHGTEQEVVEVIESDFWTGLGTLVFKICNLSSTAICSGPTILVTMPNANLLSNKSKIKDFYMYY